MSVSPAEPLRGEVSVGSGVVVVRAVGEVTLVRVKTGDFVTQLVEDVEGEGRTLPDTDTEGELLRDTAGVREALGQEVEEGVMPRTPLEVTDVVANTVAVVVEEGVAEGVARFELLDEIELLALGQVEGEGE